MEPFAHLEKDDLLVLAGRSEIRHLKARRMLFERGDSDPWLYFVVEGAVRLVAADGRERMVHGGTRAASQPLAQLQPRHYRAVASTLVACLRVDVSGLGRLHAAEPTSQYVVEELSPDDEGTLVTAAREAENWWRDPAPAPDYADLVILAQLHACMGATPTPPMCRPWCSCPPFAWVTAWRGLDPETSLAVLAEARGRIEEARSLLAG